LTLHSSQSLSGQGASLSLELPCDLAQIRAAAATVSAFLVEGGCTDREAGETHLALVEACTNAIKYAPEPSRSLPVYIEATIEPASLELRIRDHTGGFRWPSEVSLPHAESESGRGLFLIRMLMDTVDYLHLEAGNLLILRKKRASRSSGGPAV
jgi:serine/threonine-protein kinase RsbW